MRTFFAVAFAVALLVTGSAFADSGLINVGGGLVDLNGDGEVNWAGDGSILGAGIDADVVGPGQIVAHYDPVTGTVDVSMNNLSSLRVISNNNQLIPANCPGTGFASSIFHDPATTNETNYGGFPLATTNNLTMGLILPAGLATSSDQFVPTDMARILFTILGNPNSIDTPAQILNLGYVPVPEPSSLILAGLAGIGMLLFARRRRVTA